MFGVDPFLTKRRMQNSSSISYKYDLIWVKNVPSGMSNIAYFLKRDVRAQDVYRPQKRRRITPIKGYATKASKSAGISGQLDKTMRVQHKKNPTSIINFPKVKAAKSRPWLALLACGRAFVGIEENAEFFQRAKHRLENRHVELEHMEELYNKHFGEPV